MSFRIPVPAAALALALAAAAPGAAQSSPSPGFTFYTQTTSTTTMMIDESGTTVHTWPSQDLPGLAVYMLEDGNILRTEHPPGAGFGAGAGGRVTEITWDGVVEWTYDYFTGGVLQHHDVEPMPNGNVLLVAWEDKTPAEAVAMGRNPTFVGPVFMPDHVVEVEPTGPTTGAIVWEWHAWDHLIQDFDPTKPNFGVVADHPERIDINYPPGPEPTGDWLHVNSVDYNPELDQIVLSVHDFDEIWVIDHSTTTAEAAGSTGGNSGKGGDLLYRWGNPAAYDTGPAAAQVLGRQHDANWVEPGFPGEGNIVLSNNRAGGGPFNLFSSVIEIAPPVDAAGNYALTPGTAYGPTSLVWEYTAPNPPEFFNPNQGGAVRLANGNTLVTSTNQGWLFEVNLQKQKVWEKLNAGIVFKARRYDRNLWTDGHELSVNAGGSIDLELAAGTGHAGAAYLVLGSASGTSPGFAVDGQVLPLNPADPYFLFTLSSPGAPPLAQSIGTLDALGNATATFSLPAASSPGLAGIVVHHAFGLLDVTTAAVLLTSNAAALELVP